MTGDGGARATLSALQVDRLQAMDALLQRHADGTASEIADADDAASATDDASDAATSHLVVRVRDDVPTDGFDAVLSTGGGLMQMDPTSWPQGSNLPFDSDDLVFVLPRHTLVARTQGLEHHDHASDMNSSAALNDDDMVAVGGRIEADQRVLLHSCCAPCSGAMIEQMMSEGNDVTIFFYNPNIHPRAEYEVQWLLVVGR